MSDFFPEDYTKVPGKADSYMKLQQGDNRIRVMGKPIVGWEWWIDTDEGGRRPNRIPYSQAIPVSHAEDAKHFWAMVVWNYEAKQFQILEITQKSIQKTIMNLSKDEDWGSPVNYDLVITKTGEKMDTEYEVKPKPAKELDADLQASFKRLTVTLEALFENKDPFSANETLEVIPEEALEDVELTEAENIFGADSVKEPVSVNKKAVKAEEVSEDLPF